MRKERSKRKAPEELLRLLKTQEDKERFEEAYNTESTRLVLKIIHKRLETDLEKLIEACESDSMYTSLNLTEELHKKFGERKAIRSALKLLPLTKEEIL